MNPLINPAAADQSGSLASRLRRQLQKLSRSVRFLMTASGVSFICVVNILVGYGVWQQYNDVIAHDRAHAAETAALRDALARQSRHETERLADDLATLIALHDMHPAANGVIDLPAYLRNRADAFPQIVDILLLDPQGGVRLRARTAGMRPEAEPSTTNLAALHRADRSRALVVGAADPSADGPEAPIPASRRLENADGGFAGVLLLLLDPAHPRRPFTDMPPPDLDAALSDWLRDAFAWSAIGMAMTLVIGALTWYVVRQHARREADQAGLIEASRRIRGILDSMVDAVVTIDGRGRVLTFNPAAERLFGYLEDEMIGQSINLIVPQRHHHHHHKVIDRSAMMAEAGVRIIGSDREILALRRDGTTFPVTLAVSALTVDETGDHPERNTFVGVIRDISKRKKYEAELLASKSAAELANRSKSEFLANMSHELRTPLNAIIGFSEILDSEFFGALNERQKACAKDIHDSGAHLLAVVNAILDMSKIESGNYQLNEEMVDPVEVLSQCLLVLRERAAENGVTVVNRVNGPLPAVWVDRRAFRQVLHSLLSNAVKFTPSGGRVEIAAEIIDGDLAMRITDTGIGIADDFKPHLFQPFRQADNAASRQYDGVGLGLSIAKNLMELHGGRLTCDSRAGAGAAFTAVIPASRLVVTPTVTTPTV